MFRTDQQRISELEQQVSSLITIVKNLQLNTVDMEKQIEQQNIIIQQLNSKTDLPKEQLPPKQKQKVSQQLPDQQLQDDDALTVQILRKSLKTEKTESVTQRQSDENNLHHSDLNLNPTETMQRGREAAQKETDAMFSLRTKLCKLDKQQEILKYQQMNPPERPIEELFKRKNPNIEALNDNLQRSTNQHKKSLYNIIYDLQKLNKLENDMSKDENSSDAEHRDELVDIMSRVENLQKKVNLNISDDEM